MFKKTRIRLTAWYLLIIMSISICFSLVIYRFLSREVDRFERMQRTRIERRFTPPIPFPQHMTIDLELVEETKNRITMTLILLNGTIFVAAGALGYFLAGKTLRPIQEMVDEQNRFISDASHELKTPLTSLKTSMEVSLRDKNLSIANARILVKESIDEVDRLQSLSEELLKLAQYEKPNDNMRFEIVNLDEMITLAIKKIKIAADKKNIIIVNNGKKTEIQGNKYGLIDLVVILLDNAVKYSPKNSKIIISTQKNDGQTILSVKDNGVGIAEKDISHIFERFYRTDSARSKTNIGGYGLGLSIAKKITDIHGARISVTSKARKGTEFKIIFS